MIPIMYMCKVQVMQYDLVCVIQVFCHIKFIYHLRSASPLVISITTTAWNYISIHTLRQLRVMTMEPQYIRSIFRIAFSIIYFVDLTLSIS